MLKYNERGFRLNHDGLECKFAHHWMEDLAGDGGSRCPMFECGYDGEIEIANEMICEENAKCPAYQPIDTKICPKHDIEYTEHCGLCNPESEEW